MTSRFFTPLGRKAFTMIEIMVAMTVLLILMVLVAQLTSSASSTVDQSGRHIDADNQARIVFSRMAMDFANMLKRGDVDYTCFKSGSGNLQTGNDQLAFYSEGVGYYSGDASSFPANHRSPVSLVAYGIFQDSNRKKLVLQRLCTALGWEPDAGGAWQGVSFLSNTLASQWPSLFTSGSNYTTVGDQIFRMEYSYLLKPNLSDPDNPQSARLSIIPWDTTYTTPQHTAVDGFRDVAAIVVAIAVLDSRSEVVVSDLESLAGALPDAQDNTDIAASWIEIIRSSSFAARAKIPKSAASAVRVYERYFYLDGR